MLARARVISSVVSARVRALHRGRTFGIIPGLSFSRGISDRAPLERRTQGGQLRLVRGGPADDGPFDYRRYFFLLGFALFGVASGIGLFVGWLIWA